MKKVDELRRCLDCNMWLIDDPEKRIFLHPKCKRCFSCTKIRTKKSRPKLRKYPTKEETGFSSPSRVVLVNHGLTVFDVYDLWLYQKKACAICSQPFSEKSFVIDHDHKTEIRRGLLCYSCNLGIALFKESPHIFEKATQYLSDYPSKHVFKRLKDHKKFKLTPRASAEEVDFRYSTFFYANIPLPQDPKDADFFSSFAQSRNESSLDTRGDSAEFA